MDDQTKLPKEKTVIRDGKQRTLKTRGNEWVHIEISKFNSNAQPFIILIDSDEKVLKAPLIGLLSQEKIIDYLKL